MCSLSVAAIVTLTVGVEGGRAQHDVHDADPQSLFFISVKSAASQQTSQSSAWSVSLPLSESE